MSPTEPGRRIPETGYATEAGASRDAWGQGLAMRRWGRGLAIHPWGRGLAIHPWGRGLVPRPAFTAAIIAALFPLLLTPSTSPSPAALQRFEFSEPHMGTVWRIVLYAADPSTATDASRAAFRRIAQLDDRFSDYRPDSELMRAVGDAAERPVTISRELFEILAISHTMSSQTGGAFDVTAGALTRVWRRARRLGRLPLARDIQAAKAISGYHLVELDAANRTVRFRRPGVQLDLGGIAKGYAADRAMSQLHAAGVPRALVAGGGDIAVGEPPPDAPGWQIALSALDGKAPPSGPLVLARAGVSTSGDTEQWLEAEGIRYSHIIDPRTGAALTERRLVSVVASNATTSDMLATALSVMGPREGLQLIDERPGTGALIGTSVDGAVSWAMSPDWTRR